VWAAAANGPFTVKSAHYRLRPPEPTRAPTTVAEAWLASAQDVPIDSGGSSTWWTLKARTMGDATFQLWWLEDETLSSEPSPGGPTLLRYVLQVGSGAPLEFRDAVSGRAALPGVVESEFLFPRASGPGESTGLRPGATVPEIACWGHRYVLEPGGSPGLSPFPPDARVVHLRPDTLVGPASNTRQKDERRRYDGSEYEYQPLTRDDYAAMAASGINCVRVDAMQRRWVEELDVYFWGVGGRDIEFPASLYDSRYLGPTMFLDEPAVHTRDYVIRPRLAKDPSLGRALTPQAVLEAFRDEFRKAVTSGPALVLARGLAARGDVDPGNSSLRQQNLFSWETMVSTAHHQLALDPAVPASIVFEPPGRVGARRTLPEMNMAYGCQIPPEDPRHLIDIIIAFLRGAARQTGKSWGVSIYGAVDRGEAPWFLSRAYDLGATRFHFWDNAALACVPFGECLGLARHLQMHRQNRPTRDLNRLLHAAEVAILFPAGYDLGHVQMGRGNLWGLTELNLERTNAAGVTFRRVMGNGFTEIERCLRLGVAFDALWDVPGLKLDGYREVVRIREDGQVEVRGEGPPAVLEQPRTPQRPPGLPPRVRVSLATGDAKAPMRWVARADVKETTAAVYYTYGTDDRGICQNAVVLWELFGPGPEDYRFLVPQDLRPSVTRTANGYTVTAAFDVRRPGTYRLRAAAVDVAGRSSSEWTVFSVGAP
jgi:hypothetical protein